MIDIDHDAHSKLIATWISKTGGYVKDMALRDYFAAKALQSMVARNASGTYRDWAKHSYAIADAMLKARKQ